MKNFFGRMSMVPKGLRYKLVIAFTLLSIIPLLVCVYLATNYIFPHLENIAQVSIVILLTTAIAYLGMILAKKMIEPIINLALETRIIASGDLERKIKINTQDEIGEIGVCINIMTRKIKDSMFELRKYSLRTKELNTEIQRKVVALVDLLHVGDVIATSETLESVLGVIVEKVSGIHEDSFTALFLAEKGAANMVPVASYNIGDKVIKNLSFRIGRDLIGSAVVKKKEIKIDSSTRIIPQMEGVRHTFQTRNCLIVPITSLGKGTGFLFTGNDNENFEFKNDDIELIKIFSKQLGIAIENDVLMNKTRELTIKDELTGLYNEKYIREQLDEEIKRASRYQRPCSLLLFNIDNFKQYMDLHGDIVAASVLKKIANILKECSTDISKGARLKQDEFAVVVPDMNKKEATLLAEKMRKKIEIMGISEAGDGGERLTVSGGISENPLDGVSADDLFDKALVAMKKAKLEGKNRIVMSVR